MSKTTDGKKGSDPKSPGTRSPGKKPVTGEDVGAGTALPAAKRPGLRAADSSPVGGQAFGNFADEVLAGLEQVSARVRSAHAARLVEQKDLAALLDSELLKRALEADPELRTQMAAAAQVFKEDQERPKEAEEAMAALKAMAGTELAALAKLLG